MYDYFDKFWKKNQLTDSCLAKIVCKLGKVVLNVVIDTDMLTLMPYSPESTGLNLFREFNYLCLYHMSHVTQYLYESMSYMT